MKNKNAELRIELALEVLATIKLSFDADLRLGRATDISTQLLRINLLTSLLRDVQEAIKDESKIDSN